MKVDVQDKAGRIKRMDAKVARGLVRMGRFSYLTTAVVAEPPAVVADTPKREPKPKAEKKPRKKKGDAPDSP